MADQNLHISRMNISGAASESTGSPDSNKVVKTNISGKIDSTFLDTVTIIDEVLDAAINVSTGVADADKLIKTNASGVIDASFLPPGPAAAQLIKFDFAFHGTFSPSQTNIEIYDSRGITKRQTVQYSSSIVSVVFQSGSAVTAGTITAKPTINGTPVSPANLDTVLNTTDTLTKYTTVAGSTSGFILTAGQQVGIVLTSDGTFANSGADLQISVYLEI